MRNSPLPTRLATLAISVFFAIALASNSSAAVFVVDRNDDPASASACTDAPNDCSIRGAIAMADSLASDDTIVFDPAVFGANSVIPLNSGVLRVFGNGKLLIDGSAAGFVTLDAQNRSGTGVFLIEAKADVTVSHLTIRRGNRGLVNGGGVENKGIFSLSHSTVTANRAAAGGAIYNISGRLTVSNSTICFNQSAYGAVHNVGSTAVAEITDSTICGNTATYGGGIYVSSGAVSLGNTIVANNTASLGPDVYQNVNSLGYNLFGNSAGMTVSGAGTDDQFDVDPMLDPAGLADNGGNSMTVALLAGSSALDKGNGFASDDQRGEARPVDDPDSEDGSGNLADIGAFEFQPVVADPDPDPVPGFDFGGFQMPIDQFALNLAKGGSAVPVKFSLNGFHGFEIFAEGYPASVEIACDSVEPNGDPSPVSMPGRSGLTYDGTSDTYSFEWKTERGWRGTCRRLLVGLSDGSVHSADFRFR
ncbi:MAG TPA: PxKF domain-containing protein [Aridibacter sp.]|nr:PxKF domain-containing protein [Aridibacter sp.]